MSCEYCHEDTKPITNYDRIRSMSDEKCADYMKFMEIPAADVRPVVRGKWTLFGRRGIYGVMYECSACHAKYDGFTNFCPNCGADMREES